MWFKRAINIESSRFYHKFPAIFFAQFQCLFFRGSAVAPCSLALRRCFKAIAYVLWFIFSKSEKTKTCRNFSKYVSVLCHGCKPAFNSLNVIWMTGKGTTYILVFFRHKLSLLFFGGVFGVIETAFQSLNFFFVSLQASFSDSVSALSALYVNFDNIFFFFKF